MIHSTANTHIVFYNGVLLALKEDSPPYAMDPDTLETLGTSESIWLGEQGTN